MWILACLHILQVCSALYERLNGNKSGCSMPHASADSLRLSVRWADLLWLFTTWHEKYIGLQVQWWQPWNTMYICLKALRLNSHTTQQTIGYARPVILVCRKSEISSLHVPGHRSITGQSFVKQESQEQWGDSTLTGIPLPPAQWCKTPAQRHLKR